MATKHENLAAALAAFQANLPHIGKGNTAKVQSEKANYTYKYADLSDITTAVLPLLAAQGLSFSSKPTLDADGRFVLAYVLRHESGEKDEGAYSLPTSGAPQAIGSAISYARRYCLSAVVGVAPDEDDDGKSAESTTYNRPPQPRGRPAPRNVEPSPQENADNNAEYLADEARTLLRAKATAAGVDLADLAAKFEQQYGEALKTSTDHVRITAFMKLQNLSTASRVNGGAPAEAGTRT